VLLKRKGAKNWSGAIPARKGASRSSLESFVRNKLKAGFSAKVITSAQMNRLLVLSRKRVLSLKSKSRSVVKKKSSKSRSKRK